MSEEIKKVRYGILEVREDAPKFEAAIVNALDEINKRSGNHYPAQQIYQHLCTRVLDRRNYTALWLFIDGEMLQSGCNIEDSVCGFLTLDQFEDEIGNPMAMISRAWCKTGLAEELWQEARPLIKKWAVERECVLIVMQSERFKGWSKWLKSDGFLPKETFFIQEVALWADWAVHNKNHQVKQFQIGQYHTKQK